MLYLSNILDKYVKYIYACIIIFQKKLKLKNNKNI